MSVLLVPASFFLAAIAAIAYSHHTGETTLVWPATAIASALCVRLPRVRWATVAIGLLLAGIVANHLGIGDPWPTAIALTAVDVVEVLFTAWLFRQRLAQHATLPDVTLKQGVWICALVAFIIPALGAVPGGVVVHATFGDPLVSSITSWALSCGYGACIFAPAIYLYSPAARQRLLERRVAPGNALLFVAALAATYFSIRYIRFPFVIVGVSLIAAAFRLGGFGTACLTAVAGSMVTGMWMDGVQPHGLNVLDRSVGVSALPFFALVAMLLAPIAVGLSSDDQRRIMRQLRASEARFRESIACAPIGMVLVDLNGGWTSANAAFKNMLGYTQGEAVAFDMNILLHPAEREHAGEGMRRLIGGEVGQYEAERRYLHKNGSWIWTRIVVSLVKDTEGVATHFFAQIESLQAQREIEAHLVEERNRLHTTLHSIAEAVITTDMSGLITYVNQSAEKILGQTANQVVGRRPHEIIVLTDPRTGKSTPGALPRCVLRVEPVQSETPCLLHRPDGTASYILDTASPVIDTAGHFQGAVIVLRDATQTQARARELTRRATQDLLTDLVNRFEFEHRAKECFERGRLLERPTVLLVIDLDRFKQVNDQGGHAAGDAMLRHVAQVLTSEVRDTDTVARIGGDEFAVLLDGCRPEQAQLLSQKLLQSIHAIDLSWGGAHYSIGASIGAAALDPRFANVDEWIAAADSACYQSKQQGRGQCRFAAHAAPALADAG